MKKAAALFLGGALIMGVSSVGCDISNVRLKTSSSSDVIKVTVNAGATISFLDPGVNIPNLSGMQVRFDYDKTDKSSTLYRTTLESGLTGDAIVGFDLRPGETITVKAKSTADVSFQGDTVPGRTWWFREEQRTIDYETIKAQSGERRTYTWLVRFTPVLGNAQLTAVAP